MPRNVDSTEQPPDALDDRVGFRRAPDRPIAAILHAHLGPAPPFVRVWQATCARNPQIHWHILTDHPGEWRCRAANVFVHGTTLQELRARFSDAAGFPVALTRPYKLGDFRPMFGQVFADLLAPYAFWGHCDSDVLFGRLDRYMSPERLAANRKLFSRGALTVYRNDPEVNAWYRRVVPRADYRRAFTDPRTLCFEEWGGMYHILEALGERYYGGHGVIDIRPHRSRFVNVHRPNFRIQVFAWRDGRALHYYSRDGRTIEVREHPYIHFQRRVLPAPAFDPFETSSWLVTDRGFVALLPDEEITVERAALENSGSARRMLRHVADRIRRRLGISFLQRPYDTRRLKDPSL